MFVLITACSEESYWYKPYIGQIVQIATKQDRYYFMDKYAAHNLNLVTELRNEEIGRNSHPLILQSDATIIDTLNMTNNSMVMLLKKDGD